MNKPETNSTVTLYANQTRKNASLTGAMNYRSAPNLNKDVLQGFFDHCSMPDAMGASFRRR